MDDGRDMANHTWKPLLARPAGWPTAGRWSLWIMAIAMILLVWVGIVYQTSIHLNHDVGWIAHSAAWLLDGRRFGSDIIDPSPPLAWFLSLPAALAHRHGVADEITAISVNFWLINVITLMLCFRILADMTREGRFIEALALGISAGVAISLLPAGIFGQRDVVAFAMSLPYLLQVANQMATGASAPKSMAVTTGVLAGIGFCLKPYLLAVPFLVELFRSVKGREFRLWLRPEVKAMAVVVLTYLGVLLLVTPDYLSFALPLIKAAYWAYEGTANTVRQNFLGAVSPAVLAIAIAIATRSASAFHGVLVAGVAGASISYWLQNKGFSYHWYPIVAMSWVLLAYTFAVALQAVYAQLREISLALTLVVMFALLYLSVGGLQVPLDRARAWYDAHDRKTGDQGMQYEELIERLRELGIGPGSYLYALSTHPKPGFPATNYLDASWAGEAATQFIVPAFARRSEITDEDKARLIIEASKYQKESVTNALDRHQPRVILVDARSHRLGLGFRRFDQIAFYAEGERFRQIWACYAEREQVGPYRIFERQDLSCWQARSKRDTD